MSDESVRLVLAALGGGLALAVLGPHVWAAGRVAVTWLRAHSPAAPAVNLSVVSVLVQGVLAVVLIWFAGFGLPHRPAKQADVTPPPAPATDLAAKAAPVAAALGQLSPVDRAVWAEVWSKTAKAARAEGTTSEAVFTDTKSLRQLTVIALEISWRRVQGVSKDKYPGLKEAVEAFMADPTVLGRDEVSTTDVILRQYAEACETIAWVGMNRG
jgi:hypothetical protein